MQELVMMMNRIRVAKRAAAGTFEALAEKVAHSSELNRTLP